MNQGWKTTHFDQIEENQLGQVYVLRLSGQFTGGDESEMFSERIALASTKGSVRIVVDMSEVAYMNSSFIGSLLAAQTSIGRRGGHVVLSGVPEDLMKILRVTRLDNVFTIFADSDSAIEVTN